MIKKIMVTRISTIGIVNNNRVIINLRKDADIELSNFQSIKGGKVSLAPNCLLLLSPDLEIQFYNDKSGDFKHENR